MHFLLNSVEKNNFEDNSYYTTAKAMIQFMADISELSLCVSTLPVTQLQNVVAMTMQLCKGLAAVRLQQSIVWRGDAVAKPAMPQPVAGVFYISGRSQPTNIIRTGHLLRTTSTQQWPATS